VRDRQAIQLSLAQALTESLPKEARARAQRLQTIRDLVGRAVALNRDLPTTLQAGRILALAGEQDQAIAMLQTAVRLGPQLAEAYLALGTVLQQNLLTLTARDVYRRGLERLPGNKELLGAYAVSMYKTSPPEEALPHLERAAATPTTDAYVFAYLGDCYAALGRTEEAQRAYERGLRRNAGATFLRDRLASFTHPGGMLR
jgi:tetratricopeptide (TPR) repeat protein